MFCYLDGKLGQGFVINHLFQLLLIFKICNIEISKSYKCNLQRSINKYKSQVSIKTQNPHMEISENH